MLITVGISIFLCFYLLDPTNNVCLQIYQFPDCDSDEDEEFKQQDLELKACVPFAVVGSNTVIEVAGKKVRGRQYPWGVVEGEFLTTLLVLCCKSASLKCSLLTKFTVPKQPATNAYRRHRDKLQVS